MELSLEMAGLGEIPGDSAIHFPGNGIQRILFGIDVKAPELKLAKDLGYDAAISHHPSGGPSVLRFHEVLFRHIDQMVAAGVPSDLAHDVIRSMAETRRILNGMTNFDHDPSIARLLKLPFLNIHTPLDEIGRRRMAEAANQVAVDEPVSTLVDQLYRSFGEFRNAATRIEVHVGRAQNRIGNAVVSHGAGTNGGYAIAKAYFDHGVDTVIYIHCRPDDARKLREEYGESKALIVTGHVASDSVGINPYISRLREEGLKVTPISGIISA